MKSIERKDTRCKCRELFLNETMDVVSCEAIYLNQCPKSRSRLMITSACWRVYNKSN